MKKNRIIIIGAGISGLACLHKIMQINSTLDISLFEKYKFPGGRILTYTTDDNLDHVELGAGYFHKYYINTLHLIKEFDLENEIILKGNGSIGLIENNYAIAFTLAGILQAFFKRQITVSDIISILKIYQFSHHTARSFSGVMSKSLASQSNEELTSILLNNAWYRFAYNQPTLYLTKKLSERIHSFLNALSKKQIFQNFDDLKLSVGTLLMSSAATKLYTLKNGMDQLPVKIASYYQSRIFYNTEITQCRLVNNKWVVYSNDSLIGEFDTIVFAIPSPIVEAISHINIPLKYSSGNIIAVRGNLRDEYDHANNLYIREVDDGIFGITKYGSNIFKVGVSNEYKLDKYFSHSEILKVHHWDYASPELTVSVPAIFSELSPNCYLAGDYFLPSIEAAIATGYHVANLILTNIY